MSKTIRNAIAIPMGHLRLEFMDGTSEIVLRGSHELLGLKPGDAWPPEINTPINKSRVTEIIPRNDGHHDIRLENGTVMFVARGNPVPRVGDEHYYLDLRPEKKNAVEQSNEQVESGQSSLGQQEGAASQEPEASGSDHVVGEAGSEAETGVSG